MADAERRAGETAPADRASHRACPGRWSPLTDYFAAAGFFTFVAIGFRAALFGSFRSTVLRSSWWSGPLPFVMLLTPFLVIGTEELLGPAIVPMQLCCQDGYVASAKRPAVSPDPGRIERHITDWVRAFVGTPSVPCLSSMERFSFFLRPHSWPTPWPSSAYRPPRTRWSSSATRGRATHGSC